MTYDEKIGFEKLVGGLRLAIEGATTVGMFRSDNQWMHIAVLIQKLHDQVLELRNAKAAAGMRVN
jgi:hypothetical protein